MKVNVLMLNNIRYLTYLAIAVMEKTLCVDPLSVLMGNVEIVLTESAMVNIIVRMVY